MIAAECFYHTAHDIGHRGQHAGKRAPIILLDIGKTVQKLLRGFHGNVEH